MHQMKEQGKNVEDRTNVEEISSLPEKEFRIMIVKMIQNLRRKWRHRPRKYKKGLTKRRFKKQR